MTVATAFAADCCPRLRNRPGRFRIDQVVSSSRARVASERSAFLTYRELAQRLLRFAQVCWIFVGKTTGRTDLPKHGELGYGRAQQVAHEHVSNGAPPA